ncbi:hypothetical protein BLSTO_03815 [Blastocystis sp. subtype 1]
MALLQFMDDVPYPIDRDSYRFAFSEDVVLDFVPQQLGDRLMKDEYIDGEISRDISRTFPHHFLFRHKEVGCLDLLESVLRKISDNYFGLGYCQGMNFVVGSILIATLDPECNGYYSDNDMDDLLQCVHRMDVDDVRQQVYELSSRLIDRLQLVRLWGYGFPGLPFFVFVFRHYLDHLAPALRKHFEMVGFDLSIFVTRWFIPLFSNTMPFPLLFRLWDFLFVVGVSGLFRIAMSLLLLFREHILQCDLVQLSDLIHDMGAEHLRKESEVQKFFSILLSLTEINSESLSMLQAEFNTRCRVTMSTANSDQFHQLTSDIDVLLERIKAIHEDEMLHRYDLRNNCIDKLRYEEEQNRLLQQRAALAKKYGVPMEDAGQMLYSPSVCENPENAEFVREMEDLSETLRALNKQLEDNRTGLEELGVRIQEVLQELEDINTRRLSLRIQLSQLIKERSLLLRRCSLEW